MNTYKPNVRTLPFILFAILGILFIYDAGLELEEVEPEVISETLSLNIQNAQNIQSKDIHIVKGLIEELKPHQIFAAGDLADPHGTHKICLDILFEAISEIKNKSFMKDCWLWLYRGAWQEWDIHEIDMAVPMSPEQVVQKRNSILSHQSQKDKVMYQGEDKRDFWLRAEERNRNTAITFNKLGLTEYQAIEAFKRYKF
mgnify:CR=1 FL=1